MAFADIVSYVGTVLVFVMLSAQLPSVYSAVFKLKTIEHISVLPSIGQFLNFAWWIAYGVAGNQMAVLRVNILGACFSIFYFAVFLTMTPGVKRLKLAGLLLAVAVVNGGLGAGLWLGIASSDTRVTALGLCAVACNVAMFGAPLVAVQRALKAMDPALLPVLLTVANLVTSSSWLLYGLLVNNWFIAGPNVAGSALNLLQVLCVAYILLRVRADPGLTQRLAEDAAAKAEGEGKAGLLGSLNGEDDSDALA